MQRKMAVHQPAWVKFSNCVELPIVPVNKASKRCERQGADADGNGRSAGRSVGELHDSSGIQRGSKKRGGWGENKKQDCGTISPNSVDSQPANLFDVTRPTALVPLRMLLPPLLRWRYPGYTYGRVYACISI